MSSVVINGVMNAVQDRPIFESAGLSFALGRAIGGYYKAQNMGLNPITGTPKQSVLAESVDASIDKAQVAFDKSVRAQAEPTDMGNTAPAKVYRGGNSMELSNADIRSGLNEGTGLMQPGKGLSLNTDKYNKYIDQYGGAFEVDVNSIPKELTLINTAGSHYVISPLHPMTPYIFQKHLVEVQLKQFNAINK